MLLQSGEVLGPGLPFTAGDIRVLKLQEDIAKVFCERLAKQPTDILKDEGFRTHSSHNVNGVRKHVTFVTVALMLAADGKRLARRPAGNQFDAVLPLGEINM